MTINLSKEQEYLYKESKEYLDRQQNIDTLIALARIAEVVPPTSEVADKIRFKINSILDKI